MEVRENLSLILPIIKRGWVFLLLGIIWSVGGFITWVQLGKDVRELKNFGATAQAEILRMDHRVDLSDHDTYSITYVFRAPSPEDGNSYDYVESQRVPKQFYYSIQDCRQLDDQDLSNYVKLDCEETTIGAEGWNATVCGSRQTDYIAVNVYHCDEVSVIYNTQEPNKSWILGTEPKSSWAGLLLMFFGFLALLFFAIPVISTLHSD